MNLLTPVAVYISSKWARADGGDPITFEILVFEDADPFTATYSNVGFASLPEFLGVPGESTEWIHFVIPPRGVRLVKLSLVSAHSGLEKEFVGLSEVRFVPEPHSSLVLVVGVAALLCGKRIRRSG